MQSPGRSPVTLRQCIAHALDRRQFLSPTGYNKLYTGYFDFAAWAKNPDVDFGTRYPYDPEKAKRLLEEAGWDPEREVILFTTVTGADPVRLAIQPLLLPRCAVGSLGYT